jgi:tripeptide aminopeptidase
MKKPEHFDAWKEAALARLNRYVAVETTARGGNPSPSSEGQIVLGGMLVQELRALGLTDANQDAAGIVTATLPATPGHESAPTIGLLAHLDTSPDAPGAGVTTRLIKGYDGSPVTFPGNPSITIDPTSLPELAACVGHDLVFTDGTTLLGADDKAGIAAIMTAVEHLLHHPELPRGRVRIAFTSDEEIGQGIKHLDVAQFGAAAAYTLDDDEAGALCGETFSADRATVKITGRSSHPGTAKGRMVSALKVAANIVARLPSELSPEQTEGRQGFIHPTSLRGTAGEAEIDLIVRDFDTPKLAEHEAVLRRIVDEAVARFPGASATVEITKQYRNMADYLRERPEVMAKAEAAIRSLGLEPHGEPIRGGTDGSQLSERGLPTPNLFCGMHNYHAVTEWCCLDDLAYSVGTLVALVGEWTKP